MKLIFRFILVAIAGLFAFACSSDSSTPVVKLVVTTSGALPTGNLSGIGIIISLPSGVEPPLDAAGQVDSAQLVASSGVTVAGGLTATAIHTVGQPAQLSVVVASKSADGFGAGETMVLTLKRLKGGAPSAGDFTVKEFRAADLNGNEVNTLTVLVTLL